MSKPSDMFGKLVVTVWMLDLLIAIWLLAFVYLDQQPPAPVVPSTKFDWLCQSDAHLRAISFEEYKLACVRST